VAAWHKKGLLVRPPLGGDWAVSHAALPTPLTDDGRVELFVSPRDGAGRAHIARAELDAEDDGTLTLLTVDRDPVLSPGALGTFDDGGATVSCAVRSGGDVYLYYTGWARGVSVPFYFFIGLAVRAEGEERFVRVSPAPILERSAVDPYLTASPWVLQENGGWRMWYVSCTGWDLTPSGPRHHYHLRYAESVDGRNWQRAGRVAVDYATPGEYAFSRPCVVREENRYRMWFSVRGDSYRLGYAESYDGFTWDRRDEEAGLRSAKSGWDAEMIAYPAVLQFRDRRYLLYNGNGYGRTGVGYAIAEEGE
jgi:hypothetical protein